jgi:hypothetical protein
MIDDALKPLKLGEVTVGASQWNDSGEQNITLAIRKGRPVVAFALAAAVF